MAIKFPKPAGSNKPQTSQSKGPGSSSSIPAGPLFPIIDKLTIVLSPPTEQERADIRSAIYSSIDDKEVFQSAKGTGRYKIVRNIAIPHSTQRVLVEADPKHSGLAFCRLELNVAKLGKDGLERLHSVLVSLMNDGLEYLFKHGRASRLEIAIDVRPIRLNSFLFLPKLGVRGAHYARNGHVETIYLGNSTSNQWKLYNKAREQKLPPGTDWVRIERTLRNQKVPLSQLANLDNPFAGMYLTEQVPSPPSKELASLWYLFTDSIQVRGLNAALNLLKKHQRAQFRDHLEAHKLPWWKPDDIWSRWPETLKSLGFAIVITNPV